VATRKKTKGKQVADYRHEDATRVNNPPAGLAWQDTEKPAKRRFEYDPHLDPQLGWAGKAERQSFEVEAPSIHVHERLSADDILRSVLKEPMQPALFDYEELDRSKVVDFYRHEMGWENRLILGDSLVVMTSLLEKERLGGQVQMIYIDPPYGISYSSNFQRQVSSTRVSDRDADITREPEQVQAYRDTWNLGVHSYLTYLRDRLLLAAELLSDEGSIFVQINDEHLPRVRLLLDEVFGRENHFSTIVFNKTTGFTHRRLSGIYDCLLWYVKDVSKVKYRQLYQEKAIGREGAGVYSRVELPDGSRRRLTSSELDAIERLPADWRVYRLDNLSSQGAAADSQPFEFDGQTYYPPANSHWKTTLDGMRRLAEKRRIEISGRSLAYVRFWDDFPVAPIANVWLDTGTGSFTEPKVYAVQTGTKVVLRCIAMATEPGDLVLDPMCGSGTTAYCAERLGRRWITCDTSRVAVSIARERLLTATFPYYELLDAARGVDAGFRYAKVQRRTLKSVAHDLPAEEVPLYDRPAVDFSRVRVSGPFTVEALSRYAINPNQDGVPPEPQDPQAAEAQDHVATLLEALTKQGIPRRGHKPARVLAVEPATGSGAIHAEGQYEAEDGAPKLFAVSIGPRFGPITVRQIDEALHDAYGYDLVVFAGFAATAEAQQYVAGGKIGRFQVALLEANPDLLVADLLKQTPSSQTFRLFAAPDVRLNQKDGGQLTVEVLGVDLFDAATGETRFVGDEYIAAWFLDTDYDGLVFRTRQAFFPNGGWEKLAKTLKGTLDEELMEQLERFESIPFEPGENKKAAVRVVDDAGTTSEVVLDLG
jgi:adenine-specific DNA-methyltransferase